MLQQIKNLILPDRPVECPILFGPLRGARPLINLRYSLRYVLGLYEHELNGWIERAITQVTGVFDVGANHGFFCFGVMAAWYRLGIKGTVWAFEPQAEEVERLVAASEWHLRNDINIVVEHRFVGDVEDERTIVLDRYLAVNRIKPESMQAVIKIDVEGAEMKVLRGGTDFVRNGNLFLVEVHSGDLLDQVQDFFACHDHPVEVIHQRRIPVIGSEHRSRDNCWVVSKLL